MTTHTLTQILVATIGVAALVSPSNEPIPAAADNHQDLMDSVERATSLREVEPALVLEPSAGSDDRTSDADTATGGICPIEQTSNCHQLSLSETVPASDTGAPWCSRAADDFVATSAQIGHVCWWGLYYDVYQRDCGPGPGDDFTLNIYADDTSYPGSLVATRALQPTKMITGMQFSGLDVYAYSATLTEPLDAVVGQRYWLEIVNNTIGDPSCIWAWMGSLAGNNYLVQRTDVRGSSVYEHDAAFCLDSGIAADDGGDVLGSCCLVDSTCAVNSLATCGPLWQLTDTCADAACGTLTPSTGDSTIDLTPGTGDTDLTLESWARFSAQSVPTRRVQVGQRSRSGKLITTITFTPWYEPMVVTVTMPFAEADLGAGDDPLAVGLVLLSDCSDERVLAAYSNTADSPGFPGKLGDFFALTDTVTPTLDDLSTDVGDYGVFWNTATGRGFAWANLDRSDTGVVLAKNVACVPADPIVWDLLYTRGSRYLIFQPGNGSRSIAIRVVPTVVDEFPGLVGREFWVGPPREFPEEDSSDPGRTFTASALQCDPYFRNWATIGMIQVYGAEIVPGSQYEVRTVTEQCADALGDPSKYSEPVVVYSGIWGDAAVPFANGEVIPPPQPDFNDIAGVVAKFTGDPGAPIKALAQLQPNTAIPARAVDFKDIAASVTAFLNEPYPYSGPCACPSTVTCGATACTTDLNCAPGFCIDDFCTDACGRCTP